MRAWMQAVLAPAAGATLGSPIFGTLARDAGLEQVVPYVVSLIAAEVRTCTGDLAKLQRLLHAAALLVQNRSNNLGSYLSQLVPAIMTCLLCGRLGPQRALSRGLSLRTACPEIEYSNMAAVHVAV